MARWCPLSGELCMGAACAWAVPGGCAVAVLAGGGPPPGDGGARRRDGQDRPVGSPLAGRYVEVAAATDGGDGDGR